ncbi:TIGR03809 family protein [Rhodoplanes azumiensis]|uniref:TIGR03809 family protein n=1 Tax=Rhodoplanes azumiensis TaxID=1897628 RepID=A0ABW5AHR8_9BRAD
MPTTIPRAFSAATSRKGLDLAERRRAHLVDLYKSGRWRRYFDEQEFLARTREAIREVEFWTAAIALWDEPGAAAAAPAPELETAPAPPREPAPEIRMASTAATPDRPFEEIAATVEAIPAAVVSQAPSGADQSSAVLAGLS